jgi:hypothetical protein
MDTKPARFAARALEAIEGVKYLYVRAGAAHRFIPV